MARLIVYKYIVPEYEGQKDLEFRRSNEVAEWIKSGLFIKKLFSYEYTEYYSSNLTTQKSQFVLAAALWLLSSGEAILKDRYGRSEKITLWLLWKKACRELYDLLAYSSLLNRINKLVSELANMPVKSRSASVDLGLPPVYLRSDLVPGLQCGGSVGHIAGVLNNLDNFCAPPLFLSTDRIPTVRDDISLHIVNPENRYWGFQELPELNFNEKCFTQACNILDHETELSFIYQRYSLYNFTGARLAARYKLPFVLEYNGSEVWIASNWGQKLKYEDLAIRIERYNTEAADVIVVVSRPLLLQLTSTGVDEAKILVNPNGVNPESYSPEISGEPVRNKYGLHGKQVVGFIGTFGKWHGAERLTEAMVSLVRNFPEFRSRIKLMLVGDGDMAPLVRKIIAENGIEDICLLTGLVPQAEGPSHLAACDVLVSPHVPNPDGTPFFGSPTKLFEYMAMGKGIVASELDQIAEVLSHNHTAWLVKPGDPESLMFGIKTLLDDPALSIRLGKAARAEVLAKYTWKHHTGRIIEKIKEVTGNRH